MSQDSAIKPKDYLNRTIELGHKMIFTTQHGIKDGEYEYNSIIKGHNNKNKDSHIKLGFGVEAYWVKDRLIKDNTNNHIILLATSNSDRKAILSILSEANKTGYYYRPRIDYELIEKLPNSVFVTSACLGFGGYGYEESEFFIKKLKNKFGKNFMLEVQCHHTQKQIDWNNFILEMSKKHNIELIAGVDSHFIYDNQAEERTAYLESKGIRYENEEGWFMSYPDYDTLFDRFKKQGLMSDDQITRAINNTNLLLEFDEIEYNSDIKLPTIYPNLSQKERNEKLLSILRKEFKTRKLTKPKDEYIKAIKDEFKVVEETKFADYFLFNYEMIKLGKKKGGNLTLTSRGSSPSWYLNNLLNFTTIDRVDSPIRMYPERFATTARILESRSLFDIDFNISDPKPFIEAQKELLGDDNSYYMVAYGKLKEKSAWKMYAKVNNIDFDEANIVSKQLENFEKDYKHADEDEKEFLDVYKYIDKNYHETYNKSKVYQGIIDSISPSPCSHLLLSKPISEEVGLIKVKNEICAAIDGYTAEKLGFMKNDLLTVTVVDIIYKTYERIGINPHTFPELLEIIKDNNKVWDIYKNGYTMCVNQLEKDSTNNKSMKFSSRSISELSDLIAAIRPGAASIVDKFLNRESFEYGLPEIDELIQDEVRESSWCLYQETVMSLLAYSGFSPAETYTILKGIAKKRPEVINEAKDKFFKGLRDKNYEQKSIETLWHVLELNSMYSFNASHSLSTAGDSSYGAYLKSHYPYEFYEVVLNIYSEKKDNDKVALIKQEMKKAFGIDVGDLKFGNDNRKFTLDKKNKKINQSLLSCKNINSDSASILLEISKKNNNLKFKELLDIFSNLKEIGYIIDMVDLGINKPSINKTKIETLIKIDYFSDFAKPKKLLEFKQWYDLLNKRKTFPKETTNKELLKFYPKIEKYLTHGAYYDTIEVKDKRIKNELIEPHMTVVKQSAKTSTVNYQEKVKVLPLSSESVKQYSKIDVDKVLDLIWNDIPDHDFPFIQKVGYELDLLGCIMTDIPKGEVILKVKFSGKSKKENIGIWAQSLRNNNEGWFTFAKKLKLPPKNSIITVVDREIKKYKKDDGTFNKAYKIIEYNIIKEG